MPRKQAHLAHSNPYQHAPSYRIHFPVEGTVVAIHYPEDDSNRSKREIEYDVEPVLPNFGRIRNAVFAQGVHGIVDDEETILQPARLILPSGGDATDQHGSLLDTDGDRVLVQFVNGSFWNPVITHVLNHVMRGREGNLAPKYQGKLEILAPGPTDGAPPQFPGGGTAPDLTPTVGVRSRHLRMNGTRCILDNKGNVFLNFEAHPDPDAGLPAGDVKKALVVQNEGADILKLEKTSAGKIVLTIAETFSASVLVQVGDGAKSVAIAEYLQSLYETAVTGIKARFDAHVHPTGTGPSGIPNVTLPAWDVAIASTTVKIPDNPT